MFICSAERGSWQGAHAGEHGRQRDPPEGHRWQHQQFLQLGYLHPDQARTRTLVVRQPSRALYGPACPARLRKTMLW